MATNFNVARMRQTLGRKVWAPPSIFTDEVGGDGWYFVRYDDTARIIVTHFIRGENEEWVHASISHRDSMPTYEELALLHKAVWGDEGWAYQVFAPVAEHINLHSYVLHLWGRLDGVPVIPNFAAEFVSAVGIRSI